MMMGEKKKVSESIHLQKAECGVTEVLSVITGGDVDGMWKPRDERKLCCHCEENQWQIYTQIYRLPSGIYGALVNHCGNERRRKKVEKDGCGDESCVGG